MDIDCLCILTLWTLFYKCGAEQTQGMHPVIVIYTTFLAAYNKPDIPAPQGATESPGNTGATGAKGKTGSGSTIVVMPPQ